MSLQALNDAEGPSKKLNPTVALPSGNNLTAQQKQDVANYHTAMKQAQGALEAAKELLGKATSLRDSSVSHYASLIHTASDDSMKDPGGTPSRNGSASTPGSSRTSARSWRSWPRCWPSWRCSSRAWISWPRCCGSGLPDRGRAAGRIMLAATGNGSWLDVALDAFAMLTFGAGKLVSGALKAGAEGTEAWARPWSPGSAAPC